MGETYSCDVNGVRQLIRPRSRMHEQIRRSSYYCSWCKRKIHHTDKGAPGARATVDHIIAKVNGGLDIRLNCKVSCDSCNQGRAAAGHCIATYMCLKAICGPSISTIAKCFNQSMLNGRAPTGALLLSIKKPKKIKPAVPVVAKASPHEDQPRKPNPKRPGGRRRRAGPRVRG